MAPSAPFGPDAGVGRRGLHPETRKASCASRLVWCMGRTEMLLKSSFFRSLPTLRSCRWYELLLDGPTLAKIFLGEITSWDDPAIKKLNPKAKLPSQAIVVVHRSDGSGTTFIWTNYLSKMSDDWKSKVGASTAVEWPVGLGAKGNEGVANNVTQTKGAIGYLEYAYVKQNKLTYVDVINKSGKAVAPSAESFKAAAANADWANAPGFYQILTDEPGAKSWPISGATFILIPKAPDDPAAAAEALKFFSWAYEKGGKMAEELDYVPLPGAVVALIKKTWASEIKGADGKPLVD